MLPIIAIYLLWALWFVTWFATAAGPSRPGLRMPLLTALAYRAAVLLALPLLFTVTPFPGLDLRLALWSRQVPEALGWALTLLVLAGFALAWWGEFQALIRHKNPAAGLERGPFALVRHPIHLGLMIAAWATALAFGRISSFAGALLMSAAFLGRIALEEQDFLRHHPRYRAYAAKVPRLLPVFGTRLKQVAPPVSAAAPVTAPPRLIHTTPISLILDDPED